MCFHSTVKNSLDGRFLLARGRGLGVALASVGLALLFLLPGTNGLNQGLSLRPIANVVGGLVSLGVVITAGWAALGGSNFGPSSVGAVASVAGGSLNLPTFSPQHAKRRVRIVDSGLQVAMILMPDCRWSS